MKINNFAELDKILKKTFSVIRKDVSQTKKSVETKVDDVKRSTIHDKTMWDTKIKFLTTEIRKLKDAHGDLTELQKGQVDKLSKANEKHLENLKQHVTQEMDKVETETDRLKEDLVKLVAVLKEKMVTRKLFDDRNAVYEDSIRELLEVTKEVKEFKVNYLTQLQLKKQISATKENIDVLKDEITSINEELGELRSVTQTMTAFRDELPARFVERTEFTQKLALFDRMSTSVDKIDQTVSDLSVLKEQVLGAGKVSQDVATLKTQIEEELRDVRQELSTANETLGHLKEQEDNSSAREAQKEVVEELRAKMSAFETTLTRLEGQEDAQKQIGNVEEDVEELRDELLALPEMTKEVEKIKKTYDQLLLKVDAQQVRLDMLAATSPMKRKEGKEEQKEESVAVEEIPNETFQTEQTEINAEEGQQGVFSKTLKGITDFFIEEEEEEPVVQQEADEKPAGEVQSNKEEKKKDNEQFIKNIEKLFDEPEQQESYQFDIDVHSELEARKPGLFSRLKSGVVNFLFEEVEEPVEQTDIATQSSFEQPAQEGSEESNVVWKTESIESEKKVTKEKTEKPSKKASKKVSSVKVPKEQKVMARKKVSGRKEEQRIVRKETETKVEVYETKDKEDGHYMANRKPRIFEEEGEEGTTGENGNGKKKKYKKIKGNDPFADEVAEEESLYPEDYFY